MNDFPEANPARLVLRDGTQFLGKLLFPTPPCVGELVFHTSMTGYQEILTDPSYNRQIITFTYPHIGSTGINIDDMESTRIHPTAILVRCPIAQPSNFRANKGLYNWLQEKNIPVLAGVDTRAITHRLREGGAVDAAIVKNDNLSRAKEMLDKFAGIDDHDLAKVVSRNQSENWKQTNWSFPDGYGSCEQGPLVVVLDFGVKNNILRMLAAQGLTVLVLPAETEAQEVLKHRPHGVLLANGPGDPAAVNYAINCVRELLKSGIPILGICLGFQLLALALGAQTVKMKFGHHGANHPVQDLRSKQVFITSQNHSFMVGADSLDENIQITHKSLFDNSIQGFALKNRPVFALQGHPEASPGPHDIDYLFADFAGQVKAHAKT